jgi:hypothetical protein
VAERAGKNKTTPDNVLEAIGNDKKKRNRVVELLQNHEDIKEARKAFDKDQGEIDEIDGEDKDAESE